MSSMLVMTEGMLSLLFATNRLTAVAVSFPVPSKRVSATALATMSSVSLFDSSVKMNPLRVVTKRYAGGSKGMKRIVRVSEEMNLWGWSLVGLGVCGASIFLPFR